MIDFAKMEVGEKIALPAGKWGETQRVFYKAANEYCKDHSGVQFQVDGSDGSDFEKGQFYIERTK